MTYIIVKILWYFMLSYNIGEICGLRGIYMTDNELKKLGRKELLEILYFMRKEIDALKDENDMLRAKLEDLSQGDRLGEILKKLEENAHKLDYLKDRLDEN